MPKLDLSKDSEVQAADSDTLTERQLAVECVITKVFLQDMPYSLRYQIAFDLQ